MNWGEIVPTLSFWYDGFKHDDWLEMGPEWMQSYTAMLPRLIAQYQLAMLEVAQIPHLAKKNDIKRAVRSLESKAKGGSGEYDESGRLRIYGSSQLRAWFSSFGHAV